MLDHSQPYRIVDQANAEPMADREASSASAERMMFVDWLIALLDPVHVEEPAARATSVRPDMGMRDGAMM